MGSLVKYIAREWHADFWMGFLLKTRGWKPMIKGHFLAGCHGMVQMFKVLRIRFPAYLYMANFDHICSSAVSQDISGRYPNLVGYDDNFLLLIFQMHCPAPPSEDDARHMQDTYTLLRKTSGREDLPMLAIDHLAAILSISEPIGGASKQVVDDFQLYIYVVGQQLGWEFLDNLVGDPKKCGALYCDVGTRNGRIARLYMTILADPKYDVVTRFTLK